MLKVKCIDSSDSAGFLAAASVYEVEKEIGGGYRLKGIPSGPWAKDRFLIVGGLFVKCLNDTGSNGGLIKDKVYEVVGENVKSGYTYEEWILEGAQGINCSWKKSRFEIVKNEVSAVASIPKVAINDHVCPTCKNNRCSKTEKTCWLCGNAL